MSTTSRVYAAFSSRSAEVRKPFSEWLAECCIYASVLFVSLVFFWLVSDILWHGVALLDWEFFTQTPLSSGRKGGIAPIIISTGLILFVCMACALPLGIGSALFLSEVTHETSIVSRFVRCSLDVLAGVPSIVFGLFGNAFFCIYLGMGFSILSGGLTLACMVLPLLIRSAEESMRSVPAEYRAGAAALALSRVTTVRKVILPAALPGIIVGVVLSVGRALAETAALIFTSGYVDRFPSSFMDSGRALSIHIYDLSMNVPGGNKSAYASATVLLMLLLIINMSAALISRYWHRRVTGGTPF